MNKTNAARILDLKRIPYELISYNADESDLSANAVADENCILYDQIFVSAGIRGLQLRIAPDDLILVTGSELCSLIII